MDEYIEQILAEMPDSTLHDVVKNILDEPIPEAVKGRLLKPLQPSKYRPFPPPRRAKERKRKAIEEEFDPIPRHKVLRSVKDYQDEILDLSAENKTDELTFRQTPWALGNFLRGWQMDVPKGHPQGADPRAFLESAEPQIQKKLEEELKALGGGLKFQMALKVEFVKVNPDGSEEYTDLVLRHKQESVLQKSEIKAALQQAFPRLLETLEKWTQRGSGWAVEQVHILWLDIARYQPLRGGSYIPLPAAVKNKKAVVNVKNMDDHCLRWALRSALFQAAKDPQRPAKYPTADGLDFTDIDAPTPISQIGKVERQNNLTINVFGWDKGVIVHHLSKQPEEETRINLLLFEKAGKFHYTWIKDLSRLLYDQSKHRERKHFCERCLHGYSRKDLLEDHRLECKGIGHQKRTLLMRKGVYPYEFMNSSGRFEETKLPPKEAFYSKLSDEDISDDDYENAKRVWKTFGCQTLGNYADLYCRTDVLLLADVFENFRKTSQKQYGLDPAHYYTSPGLSWDALLKKTGVELELLTDYDQHLFIEKGMRGGISMVSKRHARANNPAVEGYDRRSPTATSFTSTRITCTGGP